MNRTNNFNLTPRQGQGNYSNMDNNRAERVNSTQSGLFTPSTEQDLYKYKSNQTNDTLVLHRDPRYELPPLQEHKLEEFRLEQERWQRALERQRLEQQSVQTQEVDLNVSEANTITASASNDPSLNKSSDDDSNNKGGSSGLGPSSSGPGPSDPGASSSGPGADSGSNTLRVSLSEMTILFFSSIAQGICDALTMFM
jgi:hypothetical protein